MYRHVFEQVRDADGALDWLGPEDASPGELVRADNGLRIDLVLRVRREIAAGTYDTPDRWEQALDRLSEVLG